MVECGPTQEAANTVDEDANGDGNGGDQNAGDQSVPDDDAQVPIPDPESEGPACAICREPLQSPEQEVQMLECGHAWHKRCLENTWRVGGHNRGWCPYRCDVRAAAQQVQQANAAPVHQGQGGGGQQEAPAAEIVL